MHPHDGDTNDKLFPYLKDDIEYIVKGLLVFPIEFVLMLPMNIEDKKFIKKLDRFLYNLKELGYGISDIKVSKLDHNCAPIEVVNYNIYNGIMFLIEYCSGNFRIIFRYNDMYKNQVIKDELQFMNYIDSIIMDLGDNRQRIDRELADDLSAACKN